MLVTADALPAAKSITTLRCKVVTLSLKANPVFMLSQTRMFTSNVLDVTFTE